MRRRLIVAALAVAALTTQLVSAQADGGANDVSFGGTGLVITPTPASDAQENAGLDAVVLQDDGKIVVGGHVTPSGAHASAFAVERYLADGSLDPSFGTAGLATADFGLDRAWIEGLALQPDGKIVAAGDVSGNVGLARFNPDGTLDSTFGGTPAPGLVNANVFAGGAHGVALQPDGRIVVAGGVIGLGVARFNSDGALDTSFGTGGVVRTARNYEYGESVAVTPSGKIVAAGSLSYSSDPASGRSLVVERLNADGSPDSSFGYRGITHGGNGGGYALALQPDGNILVTGSPGVPLVRFNPNGELDSNFGGVGWTDAGSLGVINSVVLQPDWKIVVGGNVIATRTGGRAFGLQRYLPDGTLDDSFGTNFLVETDFGSDSGTVRAMALQPDGKIIAVGSTLRTTPPGTTFSFALARYLTNDSHPLRIDESAGTGTGAVTSRPLGIECGDVTCFHAEAQFADRSVVTLTAHPGRGSAVTWSGACRGSRLVCEVTMLQAARTVGVMFSRCHVPRLKGKKVAVAKRWIRGAHCSVGRTSLRYSRKVAKGRVVAQSPAGDKLLRAGFKVNFAISRGPGRAA